MNEALIADLKHLSDIFGWGDEDKREVWEITKNSLETQGFWHRLANAYRNGYRQCKENHYMRLTEWERLQQGRIISHTA